MTETETFDERTVMIRNAIAACFKAKEAANFANVKARLPKISGPISIRAKSYPTKTPSTKSNRHSPRTLSRRSSTPRLC